MTDFTMEGRTLGGKYEMVRLLGQGGMGAVYEARNHLGKRFAVKLLLKAEFAQDQGLVQRFFREAKASAAIESEHIVEVYDTGVDQETNFPFIIMEMLKGEDLEHTIARVGALNTVGASRVIIQAALGLAKAHEAGIVHRDIKPANIFMTSKDSGDLIVKILDFGIAKQSLDALASNDGAGLTKTGSMLGTPLYMSPEQAQGLKSIDARTDVWSLGMCLYEALSGRTPWGDVDTLGGLILSICSRDVAPLQDLAPWVPPALAQVVHQCLLRDVSQRMPSARAFADALAPFSDGTRTITPEVLIGVAEMQRGTVAPRAEIAQSASVVLTSSQTSQTRALAEQADQQVKPSKAPLFAGLAVLGIVLVAGGAFAVSKMGDKPKGGEVTASNKTEDPKPVPSATVEAVAEQPRTQTVSFKVPKDAIIKMNGKAVSLESDGSFKISGVVGTKFIFRVMQGTKQLLEQSVYIFEDGPDPASVDVDKGEQQVSKPIPVPKKPAAGTTTGGGAPTAATTTAAPTKEPGTTPPPVPKGPKVKPSAATEFE